jgi:predicted Zn-dependent protease
LETQPVYKFSLSSKIYFAVPTLLYQSYTFKLNSISFTSYKKGLRQIEAFRRTIRDFEAYLNSAQMNIDGAVKLIDSENPLVNNIDQAETEKLAKDPEFVKEVENIVQEWAKQIEQVKFMISN